MSKSHKQKSVMVLGAGKIGSLITCMLGASDDYHVLLVNDHAKPAQELIDKFDLNNVDVAALNAKDESRLSALVKSHRLTAIISCLPYYCNPAVADIAKANNIHYFDLTEDVSVTRHIKKISAGQRNVFMPQCGLAPGFISIAANSIMREFDKIDTVKMRVGALPVNQNNALKYSLTWSTDGLINEYGNTCYGIENGHEVTLLPLEGLESIVLDGVVYEAFNTSGGLGTLAETYDGKVSTMNYKTVRYPGHCKDIKLLMNELKLNHDRNTLKRILENAVPQTKQDVVLIYVSVTGIRHNGFYEQNLVKKIYPQEFLGETWSSIQVTTATGLLGVMDIVLNDIENFQGFTTQEQISLQQFLQNRFGRYYNGERRNA